MRPKATDTLPDPHAAAPADARELLALTDGLRRDARASLGVPWFPLVAFGLLVVMSAPVVALGGPGALAPLWVLAPIAGFAATRRHYRRRMLAAGATGPARRSWRIGIGLAVLCFLSALVAGRAGGEGAALAAPIVVCVLGYAAFGLLQRSWQATAWVAVAAAAALLVLLAGAPAWAVELAFGTGMVLVGLGLRTLATQP